MLAPSVVRAVLRIIRYKGSFLPPRQHFLSDGGSSGEELSHPVSDVLYTIKFTVMLRVHTYTAIGSYHRECPRVHEKNRKKRRSLLAKARMRKRSRMVRFLDELKEGPIFLQFFVLLGLIISPPPLRSLGIKKWRAVACFALFFKYPWIAPATFHQIR